MQTRSHLHRRSRLHYQTSNHPHCVRRSSDAACSLHHRRSSCSADDRTAFWKKGVLHRVQFPPQRLQSLSRQSPPGPPSLRRQMIYQSSKSRSYSLDTPPSNLDSSCTILQASRYQDQQLRRSSSSKCYWHLMKRHRRRRDWAEIGQTEAGG